MNSKSSGETDSSDKASKASADNPSNYGYTYNHSVFIADYNVTNSVSWNDLNGMDLIFGKTYTKDHINYTMRAPSVGNGYYWGTLIPENNEWDMILNKSAETQIKNYTEMYSWGQDTQSVGKTNRAERGCTSIREMNFSPAQTARVVHGYRPVLEVQDTDKLSKDEFKVVTVNLNGGSVGGESSIKLIVKRDSWFNAPAREGLTPPADTTDDSFMWAADDGYLYAPGENIGSGVTTLTAVWGKFYGIRITKTDGTQVYVTSNNYTDPLGDGTVSYTLPVYDSSKTLTSDDFDKLINGESVDGVQLPKLTLNEADIQHLEVYYWGDDTNMQIVSSLVRLELVGENKITYVGEYSSAIYAVRLIVTGDGSLDIITTGRSSGGVSVPALEGGMYIQNGGNVTMNTAEWGVSSEEAQFEFIRGKLTITTNGKYYGALYVESEERFTSVAENTTILYGNPPEKMTSPLDEEKIYALKWAHYVQMTSNHTVIFNTNGGSIVTEKAVAYGESVEKPDNPQKVGYSFEGWYTDEGCTEEYTFKKSITGNMTLYAKWEEKSDFSVQFNTDGGTAISDKSNVKWTDKVLEGLSNPTRDGYEFTGWKYGNIDVTAETTYADLAADDAVMTITLTAQWKDTEKPTGSISNGTCTWHTFTDSITDELFYKDAQSISIDASDNSGSVTTEYYVTDEVLSEEQLQSVVWTEYTGTFRMDADGQYIIYAKLTDSSDNVTYLRSNRMTIDSVLPIVKGIEDGKTYCSAQTFTVEEKHLHAVFVDNAPIEPNEDGEYEIAAKSAPQTILVYDKAGNTAEVTITVNAGHTGGEANCTEKAICEICGESYGETDAANHKDLAKTEARKATTSEAGNKEYWHCEDCGKFFSDDQVKNEIKKEDTVIPKLKADTETETPTKTPVKKPTKTSASTDAKKNISKSNSPKTGDTSKVLLWMILFCVSGSVIAGKAVAAKRRRRKR